MGAAPDGARVRGWRLRRPPLRPHAAHGVLRRGEWDPLARLSTPHHRSPSGHRPCRRAEIPGVHRSRDGSHRGRGRRGGGRGHDGHHRAEGHASRPERLARLRRRTHGAAGGGLEWTVARPLPTHDGRLLPRGPRRCRWTERDGGRAVRRRGAQGPRARGPHQDPGTRHQGHRARGGHHRGHCQRRLRRALPRAALPREWRRGTPHPSRLAHRSVARDAGRAHADAGGDGPQARGSRRL